MKSVIEEIYLGKRANFESIEGGERYWKVHEEYGKIYEELTKGLSARQKEVLEKLYIASGELEAEMACANFKEGFKLGLLVAVEAFDLQL